jgi:hypothetical protein
MAETVAVTIRVEKGAEGRLDAVARALGAAGLRNAEVRQRFLMVQGDCAPGALDALRKVEGVLSVREDRGDYKAQGG